MWHLVSGDRDFNPVCPADSGWRCLADRNRDQRDHRVCLVKQQRGHRVQRSHFLAHPHPGTEHAVRRREDADCAHASSRIG